MERLIPPNATVERDDDHLVLLVGPVMVNVSPRMARRLALRLLKLADDIMNGASR